MKFYDLTLEEQEDELDELYWDLMRARDNLEKDNPFYDELFDLTIRVLEKKIETSKKIKDNTNEYLKAEYWKNQL